MITSCNLVLPYLEHISSASLIFVDDTSYPKLQVSKGTVSRALWLESHFWKTCNTGSPIPSEYSFPELQHLSCRSANITALSNLLVPHLHSLKLVCCTPMHADYLFALLKSMTDLEELVLDEAISGRVRWVHFHAAPSSPALHLHGRPDEHCEACKGLSNQHHFD